jgi:hypothetical protein
VAAKKQYEWGQYTFVDLFVLTITMSSLGYYNPLLIYLSFWHAWTFGPHLFLSVLPLIAGLAFPSFNSTQECAPRAT